MKIERGKPKTDLTEDLSRRLLTLYGPCIQCDECHGLCPALIDALLLPEIIVRRDMDDG
ncbi:MAG: hypothetical protein ACWA5A_15370 [Marinibacterium sp.]